MLHTQFVTLLGSVVVSKPARNSGWVVQCEFSETIAAGQLGHS